MRNCFIHELELENDRGAVETSFLFFIACFYNVKRKGLVIALIYLLAMSGNYSGHAYVHRISMHC